jgi:DNA 3'-phosphatase
VALDLDHTIITPHSNGRFPKDGDDWKFWHSEVPRILTELAQTGHGIVFLSNQQKLGNRAQSRDLSEFTRKVDTVIDTLGIPVDFLCSIGENRFRKPLTGMWEFYQVARGLPEMHVCFVGDAAGRPLHGTRAKDFSDTDIKFARNLHIPFYTPEKFFLRSTQRLHVQFPEVLSARRLIDYCSSHLHNHSHAVGVTVTHGRRIWKPAALAVVAVSAVDSSNSGSAASSTGQSTTDDVQKDSNAVPTESITAPEDATGNDDTVSFEQLIPPSWHGRQEVVLLVAAPASGKSTVALRFQQNHNYVRVNRDEMGSLEACLRKAQEAMQQGNSVVVDNTNLNATTRMAWTKLVREHNNAKKQCASDTSNVALRALVLDVPSEVCLQLARYRIADPMTREADRRHIPSGGLLSNLKEWMYDVHTTHFHPRYSPFFASHLFPAFAPTSSVLSSHRRLPNVSWWQMVIYSFFKNKEDVNMTKEGFDRVDVLSWQAKLPEHSAGQRLFRMYLS